MPRSDWNALVQSARIARERAYAPYSRFAVGAALLCGSGNVYLGCNVENAAYPACMCAERTALCAAVAAGEREFVALAVIADSERPVPPCGICRQVLFELAPDMRVLLTNLQDDRQQASPRELLPAGFSSTDMRSVDVGDKPTQL